MRSLTLLALVAASCAGAGCGKKDGATAPGPVAPVAVPPPRPAPAAPATPPPAPKAEGPAVYFQPPATPPQPGESRVTGEVAYQRSPEVQRKLADQAEAAGAFLGKIADARRGASTGPERPLGPDELEALRQAAFLVRRSTLDGNPQGARIGLDQIAASMRDMSADQAAKTVEYVKALLSTDLKGRPPVWGGQGAAAIGEAPPPPADLPATPAP